MTNGESDVGYTVYIEMDCTPLKLYECMNTRYALSTGGGEGVLYRWSVE